jgi:hypothetical protein
MVSSPVSVATAGSLRSPGVVVRAVSPMRGSAGTLPSQQIRQLSSPIRNQANVPVRLASGNRYATQASLREATDTQSTSSR